MSAGHCRGTVVVGPSITAGGCIWLTGWALRYLGPTNTLTNHQAAELASAPRGTAPRRGSSVPRPLPAAWLAQFDGDPLPYLQIQPTVVAEVEADAAQEHHRLWRHGARYLRVRTGRSIYDVPLAS